jgi:hypothetical protein
MVLVLQQVQLQEGGTQGMQQGCHRHPMLVLQQVLLEPAQAGLAASTR